MDPKLFVVAFRSGRFGNRLILFANLIALAAEQGHRVINFTFHSYADLFETTRRDIYCRYPVADRQSLLDLMPGVAVVLRKTRAPYRLARAACKLHEAMPVFRPSVTTLSEKPDRQILWLDGPEIQGQIRDAKLVFIFGWPFRVHPDCLQRHAGNIRAYFRPVAAYDTASREAVDRLRQRADVVVGVHIRHGDYATWRGGRYFFSVTRHAAWMREMAEQFPRSKVAFLVVSNEPRREEEFAGFSVGFGPGSALGDMCALARCDYIFGPDSTFSQWASFYGDKPLLHLHDGGDKIELGKFRVSYLAEMPGWPETY